MKTILTTIMVLWLLNITVYHYWDKRQTKKAIKASSARAQFMLIHKIHCFNWWLYMFCDTDQLEKMAKKYWRN